MKKPFIYIGCSGFYYKDWRGKFYPNDLPQRKWLEYYAEKFDTVELNNSFYRLPKESTFKSWYERTPAGFKFAVKGSRYVTHLKRLKDPDEHVTKLYKAIVPLKEKLSCVLWQLPGSFKKDLERLENFCKVLTRDFMNVLEIRDPSWHDEEVYEILKKYRVSLCITSSPDKAIDKVVTTTSESYIRFHGSANWYNYHYSLEELKDWVNKIKTMNSKKVFIYFNNDHHANAVKNGVELRELIEKEFSQER